MNKEELNNVVCECASDYEILDSAYEYIEKLEKENKQLKESRDKAIDMCIVMYGGNDDYYVNRIKNIKKELEKGNSDE